MLKTIRLPGYTINLSRRSVVAAHASGVRQTLINEPNPDCGPDEFTPHTSPPKNGHRVPRFLRGLLRRGADGRFRRRFLPSIFGTEAGAWANAVGADLFEHFLTIVRPANGLADFVVLLPRGEELVARFPEFFDPTNAGELDFRSAASANKFFGRFDLDLIHPMDGSRLDELCDFGVVDKDGVLRRVPLTGMMQDPENDEVQDITFFYLPDGLPTADHQSWQPGGWFFVRTTAINSEERARIMFRRFGPRFWTGVKIVMRFFRLDTDRVDAFVDALVQGKPFPLFESELPPAEVLLRKEQERDVKRELFALLKQWAHAEMMVARTST